MSWGITDAGFVRKSFDDILEELNEKARDPALFGPDIDLSEYGEVGQFIQLMANAFSDTWEDFEDLYFSMYVDTAEGVSQDRVNALGGLSRRPATKALVNTDISGVLGTTVPLGFLSQTPQGIQFETLVEDIIGATGVTIESRAAIAGPTGVVPLGTIVEIVNPVPGITGVNNPQSSSGGLPVETNSEFRTRYQERSISGGSSVPAILNALYNLENVIVAKVDENNTDVTDGEGLPPHSIHCIVSGSALDNEIAATIFDAKAGGIETHGLKSANVLDRNGDVHVIRWDEPTDIFINVVVNIVSNPEWKSENVVAVKTATVKAIGGVDTVGSIATQYPGLGIGVDVRVWNIIAEFDDITGIEDTPDIWIDFAPAVPTGGNKLDITSAQVARADTANISVVVT